MNSWRRQEISRSFFFSWAVPTRQAAVEPFLYNLFCDPDIINFPGSFLARKPLAKLISTTRSKIVREHYAEIGGGSPIRRLTEQQAKGARSALCGCTFPRAPSWPCATGIRAPRRRSRRSKARPSTNWFCCPVSALFLCHHRQQPEGMEPPVQADTFLSM